MKKVHCKTCYMTNNSWLRVCSWLIMELSDVAYYMLLFYWRWRGVVRDGMVWFGLVWFDMVWYGLVWYIICYGM